MLQPGHQAIVKKQEEAEAEAANQPEEMEEDSFIQRYTHKNGDRLVIIWDNEGKHMGQTILFLWCLDVFFGPFSPVFFSILVQNNL